MPIRFTAHARDKISRLAKLGVTEEFVRRIIERPERKGLGYLGRSIMEGRLSDKLQLRIITEQTDNNVLVITVYPAYRSRSQ